MQVMMQTIKRTVLSTLLSMVMAATMLVALPTTAHALTAGIDISTLGGSPTNNVAGEATWTYGPSPSSTLELVGSTADIYTLTGSNADLVIEALSGSVILNGVNPGVLPAAFECKLHTYQNTVTLVGDDNQLSELVGYATYIGTGRLTVQGSGSSPIRIGAIETLTITGSARIVASAPGFPAINNAGSSILMGGTASLTMTNDSATAEAHSFEVSGAAGSNVWGVSGAARLVEGSAGAVIVTIPAGKTGTVFRGAPVCENTRTGVQYASLQAAITAAASGDTIRLLTDIDEDYTISIVSAGFSLTIDMAGFDIDLNDCYVEVSNNGSLTIVNGGTLSADAVEVSLGGNLDIKVEEVHVLMHVSSAYSATLKVEADIISLETGVMVTDGGVAIITGNISADVYGVKATGGSTVTVVGDISVTKNTITSYGVHASDAGTEVTVTGKITAGRTGIFAIYGAVVALTGSIESVGPTALGVDAYRRANVTVIGDIDASFGGVFANHDDVEVHIDGSIVAGICGIAAGTFFGGTRIVTVTGNITAGIIGIEAWDDTTIYVGGNIVVTEDDGSERNCGIFVTTYEYSSSGAKVIVDGTITAPKYIVFDLGTDPWYIYVAATDNRTPSTMTGYLQYDDSDINIVTSFVWVKDPRILTPGTGDGATLWLLLGALLVAVLGAGCVIAYRRRKHQM